MKKSLLISALAAALIFASCTKEDGGETPNPRSDTGAAYLSIRVDARPRSRAAGGSDGRTAESSLEKFYLITFDAAGNVMPVPGSGLLCTEIDAAAQADPNRPEAVKISRDSKHLLVIANPGARLQEALRGLTADNAFAALNAAVNGAILAEIMDANLNFTLITAGGETGGRTAAPFLKIGDKIKSVTGTVSEQDARDAANGDRLEVRFTRLIDIAVASWDERVVDVQI
jgi:hypothetical protein